VIIALYAANEPRYVNNFSAVVLQRLLQKRFYTGTSHFSVKNCNSEVDVFLQKSKVMKDNCEQKDSWVDEEMRYILL